MVKLTEDQDHSVNLGRRGVEGGGGKGGLSHLNLPPPPPWNLQTLHEAWEQD